MHTIAACIACRLESSSSQNSRGNWTGYAYLYRARYSYRFCNEQSDFCFIFIRDSFRKQSKTSTFSWCVLCNCFHLLNGQKTTIPSHLSRGFILDGFPLIAFRRVLDFRNISAIQAIRYGRILWININEKKRVNLPKWHEINPTLPSTKARFLEENSEKAGK